MTYNNTTKVSGYLRFALMIIVLVDVINSAVPQDRIDSQILDPFIVGIKTKRPFCNAFTGCGRKRSAGVVGQSLNSMPGEGMKIVRLPVPLYRALLRAAAAQEIRNNQIIERQDQTSNGGDFDNRIQELQQLQEFDIPAQKIISANRDQYES